MSSKVYCRREIPHPALQLVHRQCAFEEWPAGHVPLFNLGNLECSTLPYFSPLQTNLGGCAAPHNLPSLCSAIFALPSPCHSLSGFVARKSTVQSQAWSSASTSLAVTREFECHFESDHMCASSWLPLQYMVQTV